MPVNLVLFPFSAPGRGMMGTGPVNGAALAGSGGGGGPEGGGGGGARDPAETFLETFSEDWSDGTILLVRRRRRQGGQNQSAEGIPASPTHVKCASLSQLSQSRIVSGFEEEPQTMQAVSSKASCSSKVSCSSMVSWLTGGGLAGGGLAGGGLTSGGLTGGGSAAGALTGGPLTGCGLTSG